MTDECNGCSPESNEPWPCDKCRESLDEVETYYESLDDKFYVIDVQREGK